MSGTVIILPIVMKAGEEPGTRMIPVQVMLTEREHKWLREIAASWNCDLSQAVRDLLGTSIREADVRR